MPLTIEQVKKHIQTDDNWGTSSFKPEALEWEIVRIHFTALKNEDNLGDGGQPPTNHWCLFLEMDASHSVCLDTAPSEPNRPGMIIVETKQCNVADDAIHEIVSEILGGTRLVDILSLVIEEKRDQYIFSPVGEGCRYWIATFAQDLARAGFVSDDTLKEVRAALQLYWRFPHGSQRRAILEGQFY